MKAHLFAALLIAAPLACGPSTPEPQTAENAPPPEGSASASASALASAPPADPPKPPEPTAEEKKKAEEARQLAEDRAQMEADSKSEDARWTPELHAATTKLMAAKPASLKAALKASLEGKHRKPGAAERDKYRHPIEMLEFFGVKPTSVVLEYGPGEGWFTEVLAPVLAAKGKLMVTMTDPNGPPDARSTFYGERQKRIYDRSPELYGKVDRVVIDSKKPSFGVEGKLDMVLVFRAMHGMHNNKMLGVFLAEALKALKPGGVLAVEQHRAKDGANPDEASKQGYLPQAWLIQQIEAAGFKLEKKAEINANPKDTKDYPEGVWTLPPTFRLKDKDRAKYAEIGESDRMTLKFVKPKK